MLVESAARLGHCSRATIYRLVKEGKLAGTKAGRKMIITTPKEEIAPVVEKHVARHGFHRKHRTGPTRNGHPSSFSQWLELSGEVRALLLALAEKCPVAELKAMVQLVSE